MVLNPYYSGAKHAHVAAQQEEHRKLAQSVPFNTVRHEQTFTASATGAVTGNEYILLVRKAGSTALSPDNLLYVDQLSAETDSVSFAYVPRAAGAATVEIIGDFGNGVETRAVADIPEIPTGKVRGVSVSDLTVQYRSSGNLAPVVTADEGVKYMVAYSSFDSNIISVDKNGNVTTVKGKTGTTTVTVTATDEYGRTVTDTCTVTVKYAWWQWLIRIFLLGFIWY